MKYTIKKTNKTLKLNENQFQKIFDGIATGIAVCELMLDSQGNPIDYRFIRINTAFERQTGLSAICVVGNSFRNIYPGIEPILIKEYGSDVIKKRPINFIDFNHNMDKYYWVNASYFSHNKFAMCFEDITELKKAEENLKNIENEYQQLFNSMVEMFQVIELIYDEEGNAIDYYYLQVNPAFEKLVNKTKEKLIGKRAKEVFCVVEDYWIKAYEKVEKTGKPESFENYGSELDKHYYVNAWKVGEGKVAIIFSDVTKSKKSEAALKESIKQNKNYIHKRGGMVRHNV